MNTQTMREFEFTVGFEFSIKENVFEKLVLEDNEEIEVMINGGKYNSEYAVLNSDGTVFVSLNVLLKGLNEEDALDNAVLAINDNNFGLSELVIIDNNEFKAYVGEIETIETFDIN